MLLGDEEGLRGVEESTKRLLVGIERTAVLKMLPQLQGYHSEIACGFDSPQDF